MAALNRVISIDEFSKTIDHKVVIEAFSALGLLKVPTNFISYLNSKKVLMLLKVKFLLVSLGKLLHKDIGNILVMISSSIQNLPFLIRLRM